MVHRDLKPANVLVRADGRLALADFGLAHAQGAGFTTTLTISGMVFGTFDYMAPEQMGSGAPITPTTDVHALGVMTYQMLTGRVPKGAYARPSRLMSAPVAVDELIDAGMANEPQARLGGAGEFVRRLAVAARAGVSGDVRAAVGRRSRLPVIVVLGAAATAAALWITSRPRAEPGKVAKVEAAAEAPVIAKKQHTAPVIFPAAEKPAVVIEEKQRAPVVSAPSIPGPEIAPSTAKQAPVAPVSEAPWTWVLPEVRVPRDVANGAWTRIGAELTAGNGVCALRLPVRVAADLYYDVAVEFTRKAGEIPWEFFCRSAWGRAYSSWMRGSRGWAASRW